jgi:hypothetical protein
MQWRSWVKASHSSSVLVRVARANWALKARSHALSSSVGSAAAESARARHTRSRCIAQSVARKQYMTCFLAGEVWSRKRERACEQWSLCSTCQTEKWMCRRCMFTQSLSLRKTAEGRRISATCVASHWPARRLCFDWWFRAWFVAQSKAGERGTLDRLASLEPHLHSTGSKAARVLHCANNNSAQHDHANQCTAYGRRLTCSSRSMCRHRQLDCSKHRSSQCKLHRRSLSGGNRCRGRCRTWGHSCCYQRLGTAQGKKIESKCKSFHHHGTYEVVIVQPELIQCSAVHIEAVNERSESAVITKKCQHSKYRKVHMPYVYRQP